MVTACKYFCPNLRAAQLDKGRDAKVKEFEDSVVEFEGRYQALMQELVELQERYAGGPSVHVICSCSNCCVLSRSQYDNFWVAGQFSMKYSSTEATPLRMEESQVKIKLRLQQLDEWIAETKAYVDESDKKIRDLGDVFQMMMVRSFGWLMYKDTITIFLVLFPDLFRSNTESETWMSS